MHPQCSVSEEKHQRQCAGTMIISIKLAFRAAQKADKEYLTDCLAHLLLSKLQGLLQSSPVQSKED